MTPSDPSPEDLNESISGFSESLEKTILGLKSHFGRIPTDNEVYRFVWGDAESRKWIWDNKGLPENQR